jgi:hypothetical protein
MKGGKGKSKKEGKGDVSNPDVTDCIVIFPCLRRIQYVFKLYTDIKGARGSVVEALCYKPEGRGFDSRSGHWIFQLT